MTVILFGTTICCWDLSFFLQSFRAILPVWTDAYNTQIYIHTPTFTSLRVHAHIHMHTHSIQINAHAGLYVPETHHINYYFEANIYNYIYNLTLHASEYVSHRIRSSHLDVYLDVFLDVTTQLYTMKQINMSRIYKMKYNYIIKNNRWTWLSINVYIYIYGRATFVNCVGKSLRMGSPCWQPLI